MSIPKKMRKPKKAVRRDAAGRFLECGNDNGRPPKVIIDPSLPMSRRRVISAAVDRLVPVVIKGKRPEDDQVVEMSIFEACIYRLGILGAQGNRIAATTLLNLAVSNSYAAQQLAMWEAKLRRRLDNPLRQMSNDELMEAMLKSRDAMVRDFDEMGDNDDDIDGYDENAPDTDCGGADPLDE